MELRRGAWFKVAPDYSRSLPDYSTKRLHLSDCVPYGATPGSKLRQTSITATPCGQHRPAWKNGAPLRRPGHGHGRLAASCGASELALARSQYDGPSALHRGQGGAAHQRLLGLLVYYIILYYTILYYTVLCLLYLTPPPPPTPGAAPSPRPSSACTSTRMQAGCWLARTTV